MESFLYLYKRIIVNRIRKALKRPITYIYLVFIIGYIVMMGNSIGLLIKETNSNTPENFTILLTLLIYFLIPGNIISYSKRKGILFRSSDIHFVFPAPVNPKLVLLFAGIKNLAVNLVMDIFIIVLGLFVFAVSPLQIIIYALLFLVFQNLLESAMIILCYGNEILPERFFKVLTIILYAFIAIFFLVAGAMLFKNGPSFRIIKEFFSLPVIQAIPVVGWNIALIRLIFIGPTMLNMICSILFCTSSLLLFLLACRVKCVGEYYEDAAKFADDYEQLRVNRKKGIVNLSMGKKKKFKQAHVEYKGAYAKAIFYRQLLEYKKTRFFIFGWNSLLCFGIGIAIAALEMFTDMSVDLEGFKVFVIPGVMAYIVFVFSGYATKWSRELENPYTYLIPDSSFKKMWHATKIEHIRGLVDGTLITVPGAVIFGLTPLQTVLTIFLYVCLMANKLYYFMLADAIIGNTLGNMGRNILKMFLQGFAIGIGIVAALLGGFVFGVEAGFAIMIAITLIVTFLGALGASISFEKMEVME